MNKAIRRVMLMFLGVFALGAVGSWAFQYFWVWPEQRCEERGAWWDASTRICAMPIDITTFTRRPRGEVRTEAEKAAALGQAPPAKAAAPAPAGK